MSDIQRWLERIKKQKEMMNKPVKEESITVIEPLTCVATTKSGKPCKNAAVEGSDFCKVHQKDGE